MKRTVLAGSGVMLAGASLLIPVSGGVATGDQAERTGTMNAALSELSSERPKSPLDVVFIHHSVGGRILADRGPKNEVAPSIWRSHPDGGGLRSLLEQQGYRVHEASYGSELGEATNRADWLPKFRDKIESILRCDQNDRSLPEGQRNRIVIWKSCFPENLLNDEAALAQAQAAMRELLPLFARHPDILFVHLTSPPLAPKVEKQPLWNWLARAVLGKPQPLARLQRSGPLARQLANWVTRPDGWLKDYPHKNVIAFDLYDVLTDHGKSNYLAYPTGDGMDSHPSRDGNERVAAELLPFLNRAVRRAGLADL